MTAHPLRSRNWFGRNDLDGFVHRSWLKTEGFSDLVFDGRPVIGIANSWSELTNCNAHLRQVADAVKRGAWSAGGFPLEFPTISLGEILMKPTTMLFRNLMAMDVEECLRAYPLDAVVLLSGCDKTTPAMLMGAASADVPAIMVTGGPMLRGKWRMEELGSGTDVWRLWAERRAGRMTDEELCEAESCMSRSSGHCMVMGTASTMAAMAEALGMTLPGNAAIPAPDSRRLALAELSGRRAVEMALAGGPKPPGILAAQAVVNATRARRAYGGRAHRSSPPLASDGRLAAPPDPPRSRRGLRESRGSRQAHRRLGAADRRDLGARAQARGAQRRARHARVGRGADPRAPLEAGRQGHGEDLRRADERNVVRHRGPPRRARGGGRRAAGARPRRRRDRARRAEAEAHAPRERRGARAAPRGVDAAAANPQPRRRA